MSNMNSQATTTYGSMFSGFGGLEMGMQAVIPGTTLWHAETDPSAGKVLARHWPGVPNLGDVTTVDWADVPRVDVLTGGSPCFPAGTLVDTLGGYRPIEDVAVGDMVRTHAGRYMPVVQTMRREAAETVKVTAMGTPEFLTTAEHPFYVRNKSHIWNNDTRRYDRTWSAPKWVEAANLTKDHFVGYQLDEMDPAVPPLGEGLAYLIGRWLGDGWVRNSQRHSKIVGSRGSRVNSRWWQAFICCAPSESAQLSSRIAHAGFTPRLSEHARTVDKWRIYSKELVLLLQQFGAGASGKRVPGWAYRLPLNEQRALFDGWIASDGWLAPDGSFRGTTVSEELAHGMARIARNTFGRAVSVHRAKMPATCTIEGRVVTQRDQFSVRVPHANREAFAEDGWVWAPVRSVERGGPAVEVYNIGVQEDESYAVWGITVHNCQDVSQSGARRGMRAGTRSGLWASMCDAIEVLRPRLVVWENVGGVLNAGADSSMEPCPGCVGDGAGQHSLRALGRVLGGLAGIGYDAWWCGVRASDAGAPHQRLRVFVFASPADTPSFRLVRPGREFYGWPGPADRNQFAADSFGERRDRWRVGPVGPRGEWPSGEANRLGEGLAHFGAYEPAIRRWERVLGHPAPAPTETGPRGGRRLSVRFVEWMMGLPTGHVTDTPGISRTAQLAMLGNGVVPQQAALAARMFLASMSGGVA